MVIKIYRSPLPDIELIDDNLTSFLFSNFSHTTRDRKIFIDASTGEYRTYGDICEKTDLIAHGVVDLGVGPGKRVAIFSPNSIDYPIFCYSIIETGTAAASINASLTCQEVRRLLRSECFIVHSSLLKTVLKAAEGTSVKFVISDSSGETATRFMHIEVSQLVAYIDLNGLLVVAAFPISKWQPQQDAVR